MASGPMDNDRRDVDDDNEKLKNNRSPVGLSDGNDNE